MHRNSNEKPQICAQCIGEPFLRALVEKDGEVGQCDYCEDIGPAISLEIIANHVESAFKRHYARTPSEPDDWQYALLKDKESDYEWEREGESTVYAIMNAANISEDAASDIQEILAHKYYDFEEATMGVEGAFSAEAYYEEIMPEDSSWREGWRLFERTIKSEARFFSRKAAKQLSSLFDTIEEMRTQHGQSLIIDAGPGTNHAQLYRARVFQSDDKLKQAMIRPDTELSAPPSHLAGAGRMNARGISVFYGATSVPTARAEVRPPVGSKVAIARFEIIRSLKLLDLTALREVHETGSIFDPEYAHRLGRQEFLRELSDRIVRPVMPDYQDSEYLPTQAIADFLATEGKVPLDGILYPSMQVAGEGLNIVLFHKAAKCKTLEFPEGTILSAETHTIYDEGTEQEYTVIEEIPPENEEPDPKHFDHFDDLAFPQWPDSSDDDERVETLSVDLESVTVHCVNAVEFVASEFEVRRYRWTKSDFEHPAIDISFPPSSTLMNTKSAAETDDLSLKTD